MPLASTVGMIGVGVCYLHTTPVPYVTTIVTGANSCPYENMPVATVGSIGCATCGHSTEAITSSATCSAENKLIHRVGDMGQTPSGPYNMVQGCPSTEIGT
jgi:hypothetical protein